jgi:hypothetical protein
MRPTHPKLAICIPACAILVFAGCDGFSPPNTGQLPFPPSAVAVPAVPVPALCPPDSVRVGPTCVDSYEASVWQVPRGNDDLVNQIQSGTVTLDALNKAGAMQFSLSPDPTHPSDTCQPSFPDTFPANGNWVYGSDPLFAVSIAGVQPTACITWFQAEQACAFSGKRLLTNQEWQGAAAGTPDPGASPGPSDCNTVGGGSFLTGSRSGCVSNWLAYDMVGNVWEWVADWSRGSPASATWQTNCTNWDAAHGIDTSCVAGPAGPSLPGARHRGGSWSSGSDAGVFAISDGNGSGHGTPDFSSPDIGFRCAR